MSQPPLHPVEDGPGAGVVVEVTVRVMVGPERSTVLVRRGRDPVLVHEVRQHGCETDGLSAAVEAAVREGLAAAHLGCRVNATGGEHHATRLLQGGGFVHGGEEARLARRRMSP